VQRSKAQSLEEEATKPNSFVRVEETADQPTIKKNLSVYKIKYDYDRDVGRAENPGVPVSLCGHDLPFWLR
jgi:hypothetical protein